MLNEHQAKMMWGNTVNPYTRRKCTSHSFCIPLTCVGCCDEHLRVLSSQQVYQVLYNLFVPVQDISPKPVCSKKSHKHCTELHSTIYNLYNLHN